jgi:hypothetical protein
MLLCLTATFATIASTCGACGLTTRIGKPSSQRRTSGGSLPISMGTGPSPKEGDVLVSPMELRAPD